MFVYLFSPLLNQTEIKFIDRLASYLWKFISCNLMLSTALCQVPTLIFKAYESILNMSFSYTQEELYIQK